MSVSISSIQPFTNNNKNISFGRLILKSTDTANYKDYPEACAVTYAIEKNDPNGTKWDAMILEKFMRIKQSKILPLNMLLQEWM